jgi:hypothetical protein
LTYHFQGNRLKKLLSESRRMALLAVRGYINKAVKNKNIKNFLSMGRYT